MKLIDDLEKRTGALKASDMAKLLGVSANQVYKMTANGMIPFFRVAGAVRFDPKQIADWLRKQFPPDDGPVCRCR